MLSRTALRAATPLRQGVTSSRLFSTSLAHNKNVAVLGASGGIGQPLSLLLKTNPLVKDLRLFDVRLAPGVAADVSHINTPAITTGYSPDGSEGGLEKAVEGADIILIPAGVPRKPGMTRDDLFNTNASIVRDLAKACAKVAPKAHMLIIANPVNSTVPIVSEVYKKAGVYDAKKLYGVTTLDVTRASTFLSGIAGLRPSEVIVPVVGGHAGATIVPLISQAGTASKSVQGGEQYEKLVHRIQYGGDEVVKAKDGAGSATLSMAYAAAVFTESLLKALNGESGIKECAYVDSPLFKDQGAPFFATPVTLGKDGIQEIHPVGTVSGEEQKLIDAAVPELKKSIEKGISWVAENP